MMMKPIATMDGIIMIIYCDVITLRSQCSNKV